MVNKERQAPGKVRAYRQAPWRVQTRALAMGLAAVLALAASLSLFIFTGAQAAEAGLSVETLVAQRDQLLRQIEAQQSELANLRSEDWLRKRAEELGFRPVEPDQMSYVQVPPSPTATPSFYGPAGVLYVEGGIALGPAYRETLMEWLLGAIRQSGSQRP